MKFCLCLMIISILKIIESKETIDVYSSGWCFWNKGKSSCPKGYLCKKFGLSEYCLRAEGGAGDLCINGCKSNLCVNNLFCLGESDKKELYYDFQLFLDKEGYSPKGFGNRSLLKVKKSEAKVELLKKNKLK